MTLYPKHLDKKIDKLIKKVFKKEDSLSLRPFDLPLEFNNQSNIELFTVIKDSTKRGYVTVTLANGCHEGGCSASNFEEEEFSDKYEQYYFATVFDLKGKILRVKVIEYDSQYGYEIMSRGWLKQFRSSNNDEFIYGKNIDAITGATVSGESIVSEVNILRMIMEKVVKK
ncbi:MAG: Na+-translocating ferredoxin:NAD+ oxidoreductase RnfG subunit [Saprospiraceae bacterium]|jgi:Na+-translocating ferredoxin:NAD+ oxidoreductase RnfG subunit